ncbi:DUF732 domain-containing protein [Mycobacterium kiyosense]|uniref:DUF732 domain-containing protein n=1 Tax=Mycobacterium kiyosense TaxID=2871094 RepID=UPI002171794F|nr:DUF732 domain-containing protein [Mycobacterium kiyosense]GLD35467.1 hypothetical protein Mkiyose1595_16870 [Mycobacterium kiyosense]
MSTHITVSARSVLTAAVALTGAAILGGGAASADPNQDDQFLGLLSQKGVAALSGVPSLIATAHQICRNLDDGMSAGALVDALVDNANNVTPGADRDRLARTQARFFAAAVEAYCPNHLAQAAAIPARWNGPRHRVLLASLIKVSNPENPTQPAPGPDVQSVIPPQAPAPAPPRTLAPTVTGPPPGAGGGGGVIGGGGGGVGPPPPMEPGIIALAP